MRITRTVACADPASAVKQRLEGHLTLRGFKIEPARQGSLLEAFRGSWVGSLTSFSPTKWGARLRLLRPEGGVYRYECDINTTGQRVAESETEFWEAEIEGILNVVLTGDAKLPDIDSASRQHSGRALKFMIGYAILFGGIGFVIDSVNLRHGRESSWAAIGSGMGAATGASWATKKSRERK